MKRILAATDFSRAAEVSVKRAAGLAKASGAELELVHVLYQAPLAEAWRRLAEGEGLNEEKLRAHAVERLAELAAMLDARYGIKPALRVLQGKPPLALAARAGEGECDLIIVGAHGEHFLLDLFVGSTAMKLLRLATVPVLLVKQPPALDYERIVIASDFSAAARAAAELAASLFPAADLMLFHAYEVPFEREMYYAGTEDEVVDHYRRLGEAEAKRQIDAFAQSLLAPERYSRKIRHGYAPTLINQYIVEQGADLLVLGAHGQSELAATLLGSVAAHMVQEARCDLLLVPTPCPAG